MLRVEPDHPHRGASGAWAHMIGAVSLRGRAASDHRLRAELEELAGLYCWACDERRADLLGECLAEDVTWEGSVAGCQALGPIRGREMLIDWLRLGWDAEPGQPRQLLGNTLIAAGSSLTATSYSYVLAAAAREDRVRALATGFLRIEYRRGDGQWRIGRIFAGWDAPPWSGPAEQLTERQRRRFGLPTVRSANVD